MTNELKNRLSKVMTLGNKPAPAWGTAGKPAFLFIRRSAKWSIRQNGRFMCAGRLKQPTLPA
jgi:hypothetical protein